MFLSDACSVIRPKLEPGETILWCTRPNSWVAMDKPLIVIVVAIGVGAFSPLLLLLGGPAILAAFFLLCLCLLVLILSVIAIINIRFAVYALTSRRLIVKTGLARPRNFTAENITNLWSSSESIGPLTIEYRPPPGDAAGRLPHISHLSGNARKDARNRTDYCTLLAVQAPIMVETLIRKTLLARFPTTGEEV